MLLGGFFGVLNQSFFKHGSQMGSKRPCESIFGGFRRVMEGFWEGLARVLGGVWEIWGETLDGF